MKKAAILLAILLPGFGNKLFSQFKTDNDLIGTWLSKDLKKESKWEFKTKHTLVRYDSSGRKLYCDYHLDTLMRDLIVILSLENNAVIVMNFFKIKNETKNTFDLDLYKNIVHHTDNSQQDRETDLTNRNIIASFHRIK